MVMLELRIHVLARVGEVGRMRGRQDLPARVDRRSAQAGFAGDQTMDLQSNVPFRDFR